jgi:molybdopterin converting factor small subunit
VRYITDKLKVGILGKGTQEVNVTEANTVGDLRDMLALDADIQAIDSDGQVLSDKTLVSSVPKTRDGTDVNFVPNVQGGI